MARASAKKKSVVKKVVTKKEAIKPVKASTSKVLAFSFVKKAQQNLDKALARQEAQANKVFDARKKVTSARKELVDKRSVAGERALARARVAVGKATATLVYSKSAVNMAKLKLIEAKAIAMVKVAQDEAAENLTLIKDELAAHAEADLMVAQDAFLKAWSKKRAAIDAKKLKKEAKLLAIKVAKTVNKANAKVVAASRKVKVKAKVGGKHSPSPAK